MEKLISLIMALAMSVCVVSCEKQPQTDSGISMPVPPAVIPSDTETEIAEIPEPVTVTEKASFIGCGDNIMYTGNIRDAKSLAHEGGRAYNFKPHYENVAEIIENADIAYINQETVMAGEGYAPSSYPRFNSPQELGLDLEELGFDVINIANNHMLDKGADGLSRTIDFWNGRNCLLSGGYKDAADFDNIRTLEKNGITFAFLSYTEHTNYLSKPASSPLVIPYIDEADIIRQTALAKEKADLVVVSVHWGDEGVFSPNEFQKKTAQLIADCGADVIIGHHPHVVQPIEWLYGKDGNRTLCVYSLGNFAAEQAYAYNMAGGMISFDVVSENDGKPYLENVVFIPTVFHFPKSFYGNKIYLMEDYTAKLCSEHGVKTAYRHPISPEILKKYITDTIDKSFLPPSFSADGE